MSNIQYLISNFFPLLKYKISGHSMEPTLKSGDEVLISSFPYFLTSPKVRDIVAVKIDEKVFIKRITKIENKKYFLTGDNPKDSLDSRKFGTISKDIILGKVIFLK